MLVSLTANAQFNDTLTHRVNYASTGSINKADNGSSYLLNNSLLFEIKKKDFLFNTSNSWVYGKSNRVLTNNDYSSYLNFNLYKSFPHFYYWGLANYNTSYSLKINAQLLAGAGVAYSLFDRPNAYLNISDGILYDRSDLYLTDSTSNVYSTYRNSLRLQFRFVVKNIMTINSGSFLQNSLIKGSDYIIRANIGVDFKLRKWLSLNAAFNYNKMNRTQSENLLFTYGLTADYYF
ncbi:hypothetical protein GCM10027037_08990 [Mucilaginibacter koreensis]